MNDTERGASLTYHGEDWAQAMADDCKAAKLTLHMTALSCQPPRTKTPGEWPELYQTWLDAVSRGLSVEIWLPTASPSHPATRFNLESARRMIADGINAHIIPVRNLLHAKTCIIDSKISYVGSGNFTAAAAHHNHEAYIRTECPLVATKLIARWKALT